jgi:hypothetical protein
MPNGKKGYARVLYEVDTDGDLWVVERAHGDIKARNYRIVSHHGERDWSPYLTLQEALARAAQLPSRPHGYFKIVEG